jgi:hypothetical protein
MHRNIELDPSILLKNQELRVSKYENPSPKLVRGSIKFSKKLREKWEPDNTSCNLLIMHYLNNIC